MAKVTRTKGKLRLTAVVEYTPTAEDYGGVADLDKIAGHDEVALAVGNMNLYDFVNAADSVNYTIEVVEG